eukprot:EG_transcript_9
MVQSFGSESRFTAEQQDLRPFAIRRGNAEVLLFIPTDVWQTAAHLRQRFLEDNKADSEKTSAELALEFLQFLVNTDSREEEAVRFVRFLSLVVQYCYEEVFKNNNVHCADLSRFTSVTAPTLIQNWYKATHRLQQSKVAVPKPPSALFEAAGRGTVTLGALFGGQGPDWLRPLRELHATYQPVVEPFLRAMARKLNAQAASVEARASCLLLYGLDFMGWLEGGAALPPDQYLTSAPVNLPLIGVVQLANYWVMWKSLDRPLQEVQSAFKGAAGHSLGIISAVVLASSADEAEFLQNAATGITLLLWIGLRASVAYPAVALDPDVLEDSLTANEGKPTPMLSIAKLPISAVQQHVEEINRLVPADRQVELALVNGPRNVVVSGPEDSLCGLNRMLRKLKVQASKDQSRVPHSKRVAPLATTFIQSSAPFHSSYLTAAVEMVAADIDRLGLRFPLKAAHPVLSTADGTPLSFSPDLPLTLARLTLVSKVDWPKSSALPVSHLIDFGPSGMGLLTHRNKEGTGVQVILAGELTAPTPAVLPKAALFDALPDHLRWAPNWEEEYRPRLVRTAHDGRLHIDTPFSRLVGKPPLMVAGMTPTTGSTAFVAATVSAGYHVELAGGAYFSEPGIRGAVQNILTRTPAGESITMNLLFLNPFLWNLEFPLALKMRKEGIPLNGLTVAAGVPSLDVADTILDAVHEAGMRHISFKPGAVEAIFTVCSIAERHPDVSVILQWTGGRAGGHHSFEDVDQPILTSYATIRKHRNIILVAGSGFGDAAGSVPYLTGEWSTKYDYPAMPFDGILMGSRCMVAKEAQGSDGCKELIAKAEGVLDPKNWEKSYDGPVGGVVTVTSELGEPIHKIATRGTLFWKELDTKVFSLPKEKRLAKLLEMKPYIIQRLNADYPKPWFPKKLNGEQPAEGYCELWDMTYYEIALRLVEVLYHPHIERWLDVTMRNLTADWLDRIEERFVGGDQRPRVLQRRAQLDAPQTFLEQFFAQYPAAMTQRVQTADWQHFVHLSRRKTQKPVPFILMFDDEFLLWFKKDTLWQSENLAMVPGQDADRVCILQGPVAAAHSRVVNQPIKELLDDIYEGQVRLLLDHYYGGDEGQVPTVEMLGGPPPVASVPSLPGVIVAERTDDVQVFQLASAGPLPGSAEWRRFVAPREANWLQALLTQPHIQRGTRLAPNPLGRVLAPRHGQRLKVCYTGQMPTGWALYDDDYMKDVVVDGEISPVVKCQYDGRDLITLRMLEPLGASAAECVFQFRYVRTCGPNPIHEVMEDRNARIKQFYSALWFGPGDTGAVDAQADGAPWEIKDLLTCTHKVTRAEITDFCRAVGNVSEHHVDRGQAVLQAPMDFAMVVGWRAVIRALFPQCVDGDLFQLVHLSNGFHLYDDCRPLAEGDEVATRGAITGLTFKDGNMTVEVEATLAREGVDFMTITSAFLYRNAQGSDAHAFQYTRDTPVQVQVRDARDVAVLLNKPWIHFTDSDMVAPGAVLTFRTSTVRRFGRGLLHVTGSVSCETTAKVTVVIGTVEFEAEEVVGNPVADFLARKGTPLVDTRALPNGGYSLTPSKAMLSSTSAAPKSNHTYARISGDLNPIHVSPYFAALAELPDTIVHGMWTSAAVRTFVVQYAAGNQPGRVRRYQVSFTGMVLPGDKLDTTLQHVAMRNGRAVIRVTTSNGSGAVVLEGTAEVEQNPTAYMFTGQGSQMPRMGMDLYETSAAARAVWDQADAHFQSTYGIRILDIVRDNPPSRTVHFGGQAGNRVRANYMRLMYKEVKPDGTSTLKRLFPAITEDTQFFTFHHEEGLLFATQFTQPALTLMELAAYRQLLEKGLVREGSPFAGHSLGEYAALASVGDVLTIESLVDVTFYRGMTMQNAVPRDALGRSDYGMCAVNPQRVGPGFNQQALQYAVDTIASQGGGLLEIVNYNVWQWQYVVTGELLNLDTLSLVLDTIHVKKLDLGEILRQQSLQSVIAQLERIVAECRAQAVARRAANGGRVAVQRGVATIPLPGIDVPFHSSLLLPGVAPFRECLMEHLSPTRINVHRLIRRYVPNLTAIPFSLDRGYFEATLARTNSPKIKAVLKAWNPDPSPAEQQQLGFTLLVELLAYQFASPVLWIDTQDVLFREFNATRLVEIGPGPTLVGMAQRTLALKYQKADQARNIKRDVLHIVKDRSVVAYELEDKVAASEPAAGPSAPTPAPTPAPAPVVVAAPAPAVSAPAASVPDAPMTPEEVVHVMVATKLKRKLGEVPLSSTIKDLAAGKSTLQNEILGDLGKEFPAYTPGEKLEESDLRAVAGAVRPAFQNKPGPYTTGLLSKLVSAKMPAGFGLSRMKDYLSASYGLGPDRTSAVLLHALPLEPAARLGSEAEAQGWLDGVVAAYAGYAGVALAKGGASPAPTAAFAAAPAATAAAPAAAVPDRPPTAADFVRVLVALKTKQSPKAVAPTRSIKDFAAGKSTLQNEILGDLQSEVGAVSVGEPAEVSLAELGQGIPGYKGSGAFSRSQIARMVSSKMPAGFGLSAVRDHLASQGFQEGSIAAILLHALALEPPARLGTVAEAHGWLRSVVQDYANLHGVSLSAAPAGAVVAVGPAVDHSGLTKRLDGLFGEQLELYARYLQRDLREGDKRAETQAQQAAALQAQVDLWVREHGSVYAEGISPAFHAKKVRHYDSAWNWAKQDLIELVLRISADPAAGMDPTIVSTSALILNRSREAILHYITYETQRTMAKGGREFEVLKQFGYTLSATLPQFAPMWGLDWQTALATLSAPPRFVHRQPLTAPSTTVTPEGRIVYQEVARPGVATFEDYVQEVSRGFDPQNKSADQVVAECLRQLRRRPSAKQRRALLQQLASLNVKVNSKGPRGVPVGGRRGPHKESPPLVHVQTRSKQNPNAWAYDKALTTAYFQELTAAATTGVCFQLKTVLITGCGRNSIALEVLQAVLAGGGRAIVTTSSYSKAQCDFYQAVYQQYGARGSALTVAPFNGGSVQDVEALVAYIYDQPGWDVDYVVPFAAIPEQGIEMPDVGSRSELAHRLMLTNVLRLLGAIRAQKHRRSITTRPAQVLLPLSPNHGLFGGDGLYAESKIGLEPLFHKWHSEGWATYLSLVGAVIGWTRGTGLMAGNNLVAEGMEALGCRTFSTVEMGFLLVGLMTQRLATLSQTQPLWADLTGGMDRIADLKGHTTRLRAEIQEQAATRSAVLQEMAREDEVVHGKPPAATPTIQRRANLQLTFPTLKSFEELQPLRYMQGMVDLDQVVVISGFAEVGPWGNTRTRWEMEREGRFSLEGCVEMAWLMGLIVHFNGSLPSGEAYSGWVDAATKAPIADHEVKARYESRILEHSGIRLIEPELFNGYDPNRKLFLQQVSIDQDLKPLELSQEEALAFQRQHGDACEVWAKGDGQWLARLRKGAMIYVPKALQFDRLVAGQMPTGWDAKRYGLPPSIVDQVDPVTLFTLVSTAEALISSGITDPYEFYEYVHVTEVGNTSGSGFGGMVASQGMYTNRLLEKPIQKDILQEHFINTMPAWVNMLLLSSSGPIKTVVGACATAAESVAVGVETIQTGKAKIVVVGGVDDFQEEGSQEFANMGATSNSVDELAHGRTPAEMSRPATTTRAGFMEAQGAGMQILTTAALAFRMGLPIYGIVAFTNTATDREGRSIPAPGQGILTSAREKQLVPGTSPAPELAVAFRRKQLDRVRRHIKRWADEEAEGLQQEVAEAKAADPALDEAQYVTERLATLQRGLQRQEAAALATWGNHFYVGNPAIAPLRGALAVWGLTADDVGVASFHGTSTQANDLNESEVVNVQMRHLGRTKGNLLPVVMQKYLTGHSKGAAAAWMLNGVLQYMLDGAVPGNRNLDNVDSRLEAFEYLVFPNRTLKGLQIKCGLLKSFGFGQVGGEVLVVHPDYVLATLSLPEYERYATLRARREAAYCKATHDSLTGTQPLLRVKTEAPYTPKQMQAVYLDPTARAKYDPEKGSWSFARYGEAKAAEHPQEVQATQEALRQVVAPALAEAKGVGCDVQLTADLNLANDTFVQRNFTDAEIAYCRAQPDPQASFAGRWSAKEAVVKAVSNFRPDAPAVWQGAGAPLRAIEVLPSPSHSPRVQLTGEALVAAEQLGVREVRVSISHSGAYAIAVAAAL